MDIEKARYNYRNEKNFLSNLAEPNQGLWTQRVNELNKITDRFQYWGKVQIAPATVTS